MKVGHPVWKSVVQVLVVRVDIRVVIYEGRASSVEVSGSGPGYQCVYRSGDICRCDTPVWEVSGSGHGCLSGYRSGDL